MNGHGHATSEPSRNNVPATTSQKKTSHAAVSTSLSTRGA